MKVLLWLSNMFFLCQWTLISHSMGYAYFERKKERITVQAVKHSLNQLRSHLGLQQRKQLKSVWITT